MVLDSLETKVTAKANLKGHLDIYRFCDNVRRLPLEGRGGGAAAVLPGRRPLPSSSDAVVGDTCLGSSWV